MKKVVILLFAITLLFGSVSGLALAQVESGAENDFELPREAMDLEDYSFESRDEIDSENDFYLAQDGMNIDPQAVEYRFRRSWGGEGDQLLRPGAIEVDQDGNLIMVDEGYDRIVIINQSDRSIRTIGGPGEEPGKFDGLMGLALAPDGTYFTVEFGNDRVQHFDRDGRLIKSWGSYGSEPGQFIAPTRIAISRNGFIYVVESNTQYRIQKFTYGGDYILSWGEGGSEPGQFDDISDIAVDHAGCVYVTDTRNDRIQKFDQYGNFVFEWFVDYPNQISVNKQGNLLVADWYSNIKLFSPEGEYLGLVISGDIIQSWSQNFSGLAVDENNAIYASRYFEHEINKYSPDGVLVNKWGNRDLPAGKLYDPTAAVFTSTGDLLVLEHYNHRVQQFSPYGSPKLMFGQFGDGEGEFHDPSNIALDKADNIYVTDFGNKRIQVFNKNGTIFRVFNIVEEEGSAYPGSIAIDSRGDIYVLVNKRIQKYTNVGMFQKSWSIGDDAYLIYIDLADNLYVSAWGFIKQYDLEGNYVRSIGESHPSLAEGMFITPDGNIYIADRWDDRILILDSNGNYLNSFGTSGNLPGQLDWPNDVLVAGNGDVYVIDRLNHRIQVFTPQAIQPDNYSGLVQNGGFEKSPALMEWTTGGDLSVSRTSNRYQGNYGMRLGQLVAQTEQGQGEAWAYTNFYVDPNWSRPVLKFKYKMSVNDILDYSDFFVAVQDGVGLNHLETVLRDGYNPCNPGEPPSAAQDLGWRSVSFELSKYKGQHIRINFSNRNLWPDSLGIWTDIDDVMVWDEGPLPYLGPYRTDLPLIYSRSCDVRAKGTAADENIIMRPLSPNGE